MKSLICILFCLFSVENVLLAGQGYVEGFPFLIQRDKSATDLKIQVLDASSKLSFTMLEYSMNHLMAFALVKMSERDGDLEADERTTKEIGKLRLMWENGVTRGGGQGVLLADGSFELLDLVDLSKQKVVAPTRELIGERNDCDSSEVSGLSFDPDEHAQFLAKIEELTAIVPAYRELLKLAAGSISIKAVLVDFNDPSLFAKWKDSDKVPKSMQNPVAFFNGSALILVKPLLEKLSPRSRVALYVHETLRQIANGLLGNDAKNGNLVLDAIEGVVYELFVGGNKQRIAELMGKPLLDKVAPLLSDINNFMPVDLLPTESQPEVEARLIERLKILNAAVPRTEDLVTAIVINELGGLQGLSGKSLLFDKIQKVAKQPHSVLNRPEAAPLLLGFLTAYERQVGALGPMVSGATMNMTLAKKTLCGTLKDLMSFDPKVSPE